jgi:hypothetical protein
LRLRFRRCTELACLPIFRLVELMVDYLDATLMAIVILEVIGELIECFDSLDNISMHPFNAILIFMVRFFRPRSLS